MWRGAARGKALRSLAARRLDQQREGTVRAVRAPRASAPIIRLRD